MAIWQYVHIPMSKAESRLNGQDGNFIRPCDKGVVLDVLVKPKCSHSRIKGVQCSRLVIEVRSPPEAQKATIEALSLVASALSVPKNMVTLTKGATSRQKTLLVHGISLEDCYQRISKCLKM